MIQWTFVFVGDGEVNFRKRSFSARSIEMMERKVSLKKENSLLESEVN